MQRSYTDPDSVYPRKQPHAPKPKCIDELLTDNVPYTADEGAQLIEALREARALLEIAATCHNTARTRQANYMKLLLAKWRGDDGEA